MSDNNTDLLSPLMRDIFKKIHTIAPSSRAIIIVGEFGSGKGWVAEKIHESSTRSIYPFIKVRCYTIEPGQAEKKLFGHLEFTQIAARIKRGAFEKANTGTLFLDGFDNLAEPVLHKIIDSIKSRQIRHVGSSENISADVRLIASIHIRSLKEIRNKKSFIDKLFELDPYFIYQPPLRKRREDISNLIHSFLNNELRKRYGFESKEISPRALYQCISYHWPGNISQLKNAIEHASIISAGNSIQPEHLPLSVKLGQPEGQHTHLTEGFASFQAAEKKLITQVLEETQSVAETASLLGLSESLLDEKIDNYQCRQQIKKIKPYSS